MTPDDLARIHARAMTLPPPWDARAIAGLLHTPGTFLVTLPSPLSKYAGGDRGSSAPSPDFSTKNRPPATPQAAQPLIAFALSRVILDEAELLTLAVDPDHRRRGLGQNCLAAFETTALDRGALRAFLEVAATNAAARALYTRAGYAEIGTRRGYYRAPGCDPVDAILMSKALSPA